MVQMVFKSGEERAVNARERRHLTGPAAMPGMYVHQTPLTFS